MGIKIRIRPNLRVQIQKKNYMNEKTNETERVQKWKEYYKS